MFSTFLVDDEIAAREAVRAAAPWEELGFELIGETGDGELALDLLREARPDVLITDIRMPYMDGLELCRRVRRELPEVRIVIVSACADFERAREALALGVRAFLPKPLDAAALRRALSDIAEELRRERARREREAALREYLSASGRYLCERLLGELYAGADAGELLRAARGMRMNLTAKCYLALVLRPAAGIPDGRALARLEDALDRAAAASGATAFLRRSGAEFSYLVLGDDPRHLRARAEVLAGIAQREAERAAGVGLAAAFGAAVERLEDAPASLADARAQLRAPDDGTLPGPAPGDTLEALPPEALELSPLAEELRFAAPGDVDAIVAHRAKALGADRSAAMAAYLYVDAQLAAARVVRNCRGSAPEAAPEFPRGNLGADALLSLSRDALRRALEYRDARNPSRYGPMIRRAKRYIEDRFADPGLALRDVAAHVALSNNHFCTVFARETGATFGEYLTGLRIERAKDLLRNTNMRTGEIAYAVGYNDPHYFSNLFKKRTGVSPRDYRRGEQVN